MSLSDKEYVIEEIKTKEGAFHERHHRRQGHKVMVTLLEKGAPILYYYTNGDGFMRTSSVQEIEDDGEVVTATTHNTVYKFRKVNHE